MNSDRPPAQREQATASDRLIIDAYERAAEHRERAALAPFVPDDVVDTDIAAAEYFAAVIEYYSRLEPHLPDRPHYWKQVPLIPDPVDSGRDQVVTALMDFYNVDHQTALQVLEYAEDDPSFPIDEPDDDVLHGLRSLQAWRSRTTRVRDVRDDVLDGAHVVERNLPQYLPRQHTLRVHTVLDEAAAKLGFGPEGEIPEEWEKDPV